MSDFQDRIKSFPYILRSYEDAMDAAFNADLKGDDLEHFLSKNCRVYFFEHYLKVEREGSDQEIRDVNKSPIVPFVLSEAQLEVMEKFEKRMFSAKKFRIRIMKCRRARVSTICLACAYHICRFGENKKGLVFADKLETSRKLRKLLDTFYQGDTLCRKPIIGKRTLAEGLYLHPEGTEKSKTEKDSYILLGSGEQANTGIGGSLDFMIWSEAALTPDAETSWTTISPSLQGALFDIAESTPSMTGQDPIIFPAFETPSANCDTLFISWLDVLEYRIDDPELVARFSPYLDHHLYGKEAELIAEHEPTVQQMLWRRFKLDELKNASAFKQVFPISEKEAFYSSAGLFFHGDVIKMTRPKEKIAPKQYSFSDQGNMNISALQDNSGLWKIYKLPVFTHGFLIAVDIAEGRTSDKDGRDPDYSVAMIFSLTKNMEEVAVLRERMPPEVLAEQVAAAAMYYNNAMVIPERNSAGIAFIVRLNQIYQNIYREQKLNNGSFLVTQELGYLTTSVSKVFCLSSLRSQIVDPTKGMTIHTDSARQEMEKFQQKGPKIGAMAGHHDDLVSVMWLAAACVAQSPSMLIDPNLGGENLGGLNSGGQTPLKPVPSGPNFSRPNWNYATK